MRLKDSQDGKDAATIKIITNFIHHTSSLPEMKKHSGENSEVRYFRIERNCDGQFSFTDKCRYSLEIEKSTAANEELYLFQREVLIPTNKSISKTR
jgi:hypothetical protein